MHFVRTEQGTLAQFLTSPVPFVHDYGVSGQCGGRNDL